MSRFYGMHVTITGYDLAREEAIKRAAADEWDFAADQWNAFEGELACYREDCLCGGEGEDEFAKRLIEAIWIANGDFCDVRVTATYLENLPYEEYSFDREEYARWKSLS